ncbi:MAG: hypothetical protein A3G52_01015 [Candidatus Taylorbacteria bacterium RIFCSPLOWO2_12_FULL_43_20]|uniref:UPF0182 protein A2936_05730 n=2 Tax=Parcubacteria group TaxID=1794811 RepID=A0A1F7URH9_9BACT|nr:MAG: hypothetical protein UX68_C0015G0007 [Parcubacteria group bacterium GW2011_GWA2_46_9]OGL59893.1 MAG: hypothetical protein A2752_04095 [Candidatus Uhrbacteria bacterium RIFCSPHIGHO2_01_FULL_46_23]OGL69444.1 MAG: hypothetical protein A3D60_03165 [Candidatus Uhrbacteria bacterium RIFCSPHIGHO2_02_FULL_47_29]OGL75356.1 MAG: hypothetical protein A3E96_02485 [Candidatus Uhrbacteria bacterium RIFCSPHIGHO2_12_FULL_46_13]OGL80900.1 MAG: hypothetical protein A2936_05730 [Candidatus Uhrbacteria bac
MTIPKYLTRISFTGLFVVFILFSSIIGFVTDWWWFSEIGHTQIFIKSLVAKIALFSSVGIFAAIFLLTNFFLAIRSKISWIAVLPEALIGRSVDLDNHLIKKLAVVLSLVIALFFGFTAAAGWQDILKFIAGSTFGATDPIFNKDIGFYVFSLPVFYLGLGLIKFLVLVALVGSAIIYFLRGNLYVANLRSFRQMQIERAARIHLGILLAIFLATIVAGIYLSRFTLLTSQSGLVFGATYTDATVRIFMLWISMTAAVFAAVLAAFWAWKGKLSPLVGAVSLYVVVGFVGAVIPSLVQKLVVAPNELVKEMPFIKHNIAATRQGFALDTIEEREISGDKPITAADITNNNLTVKNVRLWDRKPLLSTFSQIQEIRTYYEFAEVDNDRYIIDGEIRQIMLSPRELASESLPNKNWINERLTFTHGYGVAAGPVNQVTPEGLPVLFVKDLPPKSDVKELEISRPEIYFGELSNDYVITKTKSREFDYPKGEENVYATYEGKGGVEINSLLKRIFYAVKFQSLKLLLSNDITSESRILYYRTIAERVAKIAPFLTFDRDPYIVIADGKVYWIADAYTTSDRYPYSQPLLLNGKSVNYVRNSVKVVVDAYNGSVVFYQADAGDPILKTYATIFPGTFRPLSEMPESLVSHLRYPEDIFTLQTAAYSVYHMDDPQIFYNKEDQWEIPAIPSEGEGASRPGAIPPMQPRHIIMKLPGEQKEEYVLMLPFTPRAKDNLSAWMVARNDGESYGKLLVYRFPKDKLVFGPKQIIGRINQDSEISQQISLWSQGGSQVIQGPLLVIPIEESLLYVRPLYLKAEAGKIPELKRVVVAYENKIAMEETLEEGLSKIFGIGAAGKSQQGAATKTPSSNGPPAKDVEERIQRAASAYEEALRAQREGDWTRYGEAIRRLGDILK